MALPDILFFPGAFISIHEFVRAVRRFEHIGICSGVICRYSH